LAKVSGRRRDGGPLGFVHACGKVGQLLLPGCLVSFGIYTGCLQ
jgi:hypothetical protein